MIKIYTMPNCSWCRKAKDLLNIKKIEYDEIDLKENPDALMEVLDKSGQYGVPVLDVNGTIIVGFDENAIRTIL